MNNNPLYEIPYFMITNIFQSKRIMRKVSLFLLTFLQITLMSGLTEDSWLLIIYDCTQSVFPNMRSPKTPQYRMRVKGQDGLNSTIKLVLT